jgi:hypothetical protein
MQEVTVNKLTRVLNQIADYRTGKIDLRYLVSVLEGTILSMEERLPKEFLSAWQRAYINLETIHALDKESAFKNKIQDELVEIEALISDILSASGGISDN